MPFPSGSVTCPARYPYGVRRIVPVEFTFWTYTHVEFSTYWGAETRTWSQPAGAEMLKKPSGFATPAPHTEADEAAPAGQTSTPASPMTGVRLSAWRIRPETSDEVRLMEATLGSVATDSGNGISFHWR